MVHHVSIALCVYQPKSNLLPSHYIRPRYPSLPPPLFSGSHCRLRQWVSACLFVFVCLPVAFSFISHIWSYTVLDFVLWLISPSMKFSRSIHVVANGSISSCLVAEWYPIVYVPPSPLSKNVSVSTSRPPWIMLQGTWGGGTYILTDRWF